MLLKSNDICGVVFGESVILTLKYGGLKERKKRQVEIFFQIVINKDAVSIYKNQDISNEIRKK